MRAARGRHGMNSVRALAFAFVLAPWAALMVASMGACVDGATPDCSDPKVQCGPDLDGAADRAETAADSGSTDTSLPDVADAQPDPDAGDI